MGIPDRPDAERSLGSEPGAEPRGCHEVAARAGKVSYEATDTDACGLLAQRVLFRPRVVYGERVVLARRSWSVGASLFPGRRAGETGAAYYVRVNQWRHQNGIPEQVYARVLPVWVPARAETPHARGRRRPREEDKGATLNSGARLATRPHVRASRDFLKPQFVDFADPLLVNLFGKLPGTLQRYVELRGGTLSKPGAVP
jgi:hypothetical protein